MIYNYHYYENIGDYIQSLAALQYLPKNCKPYLVDRNRIQYYNGPNVKLIMNSWNKIVGGTKYISDKINPIFYLIILTNQKFYLEYIYKIWKIMLQLVVEIHIQEIN